MAQALWCNGHLGGTHYPTILVLNKYIEGFESFSFGSDRIKGLIKKEQELKLQINQHVNSSNLLRGGYYGDVSPVKTPSEANLKEDWLEKIELLLEQDRSMRLQIDDLKKEVEKLRGIVNSPSSQKPALHARPLIVQEPFDRDTSTQKREIKHLVLIMLISLCVVVAMALIWISYLK